MCWRSRARSGSLDGRQQAISGWLTALPAEGWERLSAGQGSKGPRVYGWKRWLLIRRSVSGPCELAAYVVYALQETTLHTQVQVAGRRWTVEERIQTTKGEVGLDHYEARSWTGWYRHLLTLSTE